MKLSEGQKRSYTMAATRYNSTVRNAASYLGRRGLYDGETIRSYLLGHVTDPLPGDEPVAGRLCIPYVTPSGVVNLKFRCIKDHNCKDIPNHPKYLGRPGAEDRIYNVQALHDAGSVIHVSRGELDALSATMVGFPTIGISGDNKWLPHYTKLLEDFDDVVLFADGDKSGRDAAKYMRGELDNARIVYFPPGQDVNSLLVEGTVDGFRDLVGG
jgi:Toprim-like